MALQPGGAVGAPAQRLVRTYAKGDIIFEEGQCGGEMFLVHSGKVELLLRAGKAAPVRLVVIGPGDFFGEMALLDDCVRSATAAALEENTQLLAIDRGRFLFMVRQQPEFALSLMHVLCQRIRDLNGRLGAPGAGA
jgi:CRP/FNR family cyclic AMP-dependent transcriptional regulator